jgi:hypothetical protein
VTPANYDAPYKIIKEVYTIDYIKNEITIDRWIQPSKPVKFIQLNFTVTPDGVKFE